MQKYLDNIILELTKEIQEKTVEWVFQAIEKTREIEITLYQKSDEIALERYPNDRRERIWAGPSIRKQIIEETIGANTYNVGKYYMQRGVNRNSRAAKVLDDVQKDFDKKRASLKNKILKSVDKCNSEIKEISEIYPLDNNTLGAEILLENNDKIIISVICAGGYNIQCFHYRSNIKIIKHKGK